MTAPESTQTAIDLAGARILCVDDVPENLDVLFQTLEELECEVLVARDGESALTLAARARPELILLDVMMPGIDGYETCRRLQADPTMCDIPVLFLTARQDVEGVVEGFDAGGLDYVLKPFRREEVVARLRTHLERSRLLLRLDALVTERTRQLQRKVRELDACDRIARHMLAVRPLKESLQLVVDIALELIDADGATLALAKGAGQARAMASGGVEDQDCIEVAAVDIERGEQRLGELRVYRRAPAPKLDDDDRRLLDRLALETAVLIHDARLRASGAAWRGRLDEILAGDEEISGDEVLDRLQE